MNLTRSNQKIILGIILLIFSALMSLFADTPKHDQNTNTSYLVTEVVDGDTIKLMIDGEEQTARLIGIDTPETVDPRKDVQCYGKEASDQTKRLLLNQLVEIEFDSSQTETDKYGRLLLYIWRISDNLFVNEYLVKEGYAREYTYNIPYKYQSLFKQLQTEAMNNKRGLWGDVCN